MLSGTLVRVLLGQWVVTVVWVPVVCDKVFPRILSLVWVLLGVCRVLGVMVGPLSCRMVS